MYGLTFWYDVLFSLVFGKHSSIAVSTQLHFKSLTVLIMLLLVMAMYDSKGAMWVYWIIFCFLNQWSPKWGTLGSRIKYSNLYLFIKIPLISNSCPLYNIHNLVVFLQLLSRVQLFTIPWTTVMDCSMTDSSVLHYLLEFAEIHVHWIGDTI